MRPIVPAALLAAAALAAPAALVACGDDDEDGAPRAAASGPAGLPFPPRAQEPATAPEPEREPEGEVVRVGPGPEGVASDPQTGTTAVGLRDGRLALVETATGRTRRTVRLPAAPRHVTLARPGGPFLVPGEDSDRLAAVDPRTGAVRTIAVGDEPHDATRLPDGRLAVGDEFGSTVSIVRGGRTVATWPVDVQPGGVVAAGDQVAVVSVRANTVELLDPDTGRTGGSQNAGYGPSHVAADDEGRLYITDTRGGALLVFQTRPRLKAVGRVELGDSPYGLAVDRRRGRVLVTSVGRNELTVLTTGDVPRRVRTVPTVRQPNTLAVDERTGRVVIASRTDGTLQLVGG